MGGSVQVQFRLPASVRKEGKWFYSSCPLLDVHSQGTTRREALGNLKEAVGLFVESCYKRGTLGKVLLSCGFVPGERPISPSVRAGAESVNVPLSLISRGRVHAEARTH